MNAMTNLNTQPRSLRTYEVGKPCQVLCRPVVFSFPHVMVHTDVYEVPGQTDKVAQSPAQLPQSLREPPSNTLVTLRVLYLPTQRKSALDIVLSNPLCNPI